MQLGKTVNVDGATICSWELGETQPHKGTLNKMNTMWEKEIGPLLGYSKHKI